MYTKILFGCFVIFSLSACVSAPVRGDREVPMQPVFINTPVQQQPAQAVTGGLYNENLDMRLWEDRTAHRVGDILTVQLSEQTSAQKAQNTSLSRGNTVSVGTPTLMGMPVTVDGTPILGAEIAPTQTFDGAGTADQSNQLSGNISVTVTAVQPNGNLMIQGQKQIELNDGSETIFLTGVVRPADINTDNSVVSTRIADARISYTGQGMIKDSNRLGWLSKFFMSVIWPF